MRLMFLVVWVVLAAACVRLEAQTLRGLGANGDAFQMTVTHNSDGSVSVVTQSISPEPGDIVYVALYDGAFASYTPDDGVTVSDGPYWFVPFDPAETPFRTAAKTWTCPCTAKTEGGATSGKCLVRTSDFVTFNCVSEQCTGQCELKESGRVIGIGGGVVVSATSVDVNGVVFQ